MSALWDKLQNLFDGKTINVSWRFWGVKALEPKMPDVMTIEREWFSDKRTLGQLFFDGVHFCFTLEDTCRRKKVYGETAIPSGRYEVVIDFSEKHKREMPHILDVPGFTGIRFDIANKETEVLGCVAVGYGKSETQLYDSRKAHEALMVELRKRLEKGKVYVSIVGGISKDQFEA